MEKLVARDEVLARVNKDLKKAQENKKRYSDFGQRKMSFKPRNPIYLKLQPYRQKIIRKKLNMKSQYYYIPFKVLERVGKVAYRLELPPMALIHPIFHVSLLKKKVDDP